MVTRHIYAAKLSKELAGTLNMKSVLFGDQPSQCSPEFQA
ncbi:hypothetical protein J532_2579 [Acinetobacter baumannii 940793]|nr:hypothetical protein J494_1822 [Acinetobacter baumannii 29280]EXG15755.1 hypothetical protein J727_1041 [Acinetobacter baumannii 472237-120]EXH09017.1 hypothetical protein J641_3332 [Acinetobacter baumannii 1188188]EXH19574.1 hypothetical protein J636_0566 [Acinetobacter baumannii 1271213]EXH27315.1 hypothetical protein J643_0740 [Acinetobacter baumannii 1237893]EXI08499.1 hypothetical protein J644_0995 [Acinetobacter baumannii 480175]EYT37245.1 hypothetical protein J497_02708 [Acinetobact